MALGDPANANILTPDGLPASEREALVERARYQAFREKGANARAVRQSALAFFATGLVAAGVSLLVMPVLESSLLARAIFTGAVAGCWGGLSAYWISRDRAKIINAKIRELLEREQKDDSLPTAGPEK